MRTCSFLQKCVEKAVTEGVSRRFSAYSAENCREMFDRKKKSMDNLTFYGPVAESATYADSLKVSIPTYDDKYASDFEVLDDRGESCNHSLPIGETFSARALISVAYGYSLNKNSYGIKLFAKTLQLMDKPEEEKAPLPGKEDPEAGGGGSSSSSVAAEEAAGAKGRLGNAFL